MDLLERPSRVAAASTQNLPQLNWAAPYVDGAALPAGTHAVAYAGAQLAASGGFGSGFVFTAVNDLPPGLTLSGAGAIAGTPLYAGAWIIVFVVTDTAGNSVSAKMTLTVA